MALSHPIIDQVTHTLHGNPYFNGRQIRIEEAEGRIVLQGQVKSFFQKQMAQEAVRRISGIHGVDNLIEVMRA
jgi:osmotically-inducible protein OsmY